MSEKSYIRDSRSPKPKSENVSRIMSANKSKNTKPEILFRKTLWKIGKRGYRLNYKKISGRPDIVFVSKKIAIFIHGCFWHRCPICNLPLPINNRKFWQNKFEKNQKRDFNKVQDLKMSGWKVFSFWECELKKDVDKLAKKIDKEIAKIKT
ncbi:MAG: very short patch repair endonuclease [Bacteroidetes bacterium]|nr:very short patch repair endonuclease [Bacteroidota bacterium]